jgi:hypothetical protein
MPRIQAGASALFVCLGMAASAAAQERTVFSYSDDLGRKGCFVHLNGHDWLELTGGGDRFSFVEVNRDEGSIELLDKARGGVSVRLFADKSQWKTKEETRGSWASLWKGTWTTSADLRPEFTQRGLVPVRQGDRGTCSVFTTNSALELAFSRYLGRSVHLSVEYLNWAANQVTGHPTDGQFFHNCLAGFNKYGVCIAANMPYVSKFDASLAPSKEARANARHFHSLAAKGIRIHWINPLKPKPGLTVAHLHEIQAVLAIGWPVAAGAEHSRLLVGYRDDPKQPGGGLFFDKDSATGRYEEVTYRFVKTNVADVFWVEALGTSAEKHK